MIVLGNLNRCVMTSCTSSQVVIASGQSTSVPALFQDDSALYWNGSQIMHLTK